MARRGKKKGRPVSGWVILDKPVGMGSTEAVSKVKWLFQAEKAGHAGTLERGRRAEHAAATTAQRDHRSTGAQTQRP